MGLLCSVSCDLALSLGFRAGWDECISWDFPPRKCGLDILYEWDVRIEMLAFFDFEASVGEVAALSVLVMVNG